jgi:ATP synthase protein I
MNGKGNDAKARTSTSGGASTAGRAGTRSTAGKTRVQASRDGAAADGRAQGLDVGWAVSGYLISGMIAYGGIGWLIGRAVHVSLLFPIGMLIGLAISIAFIIYRYGKQDAVGRTPRKEMTGDR